MATYHIDANGNIVDDNNYIVAASGRGPAPGSIDPKAVAAAQGPAGTQRYRGAVEDQPDMGVSRYGQFQFPTQQQSLDDILASGDTRVIQQALINAGYNPGKVDGLMGPKTQSAIDAYQASKGGGQPQPGGGGGGYTGGGGGGAPPGGAGVAPQQPTPAPTTLDASEYLKGVLSQYGLESLTGWAMDKFQHGYTEGMLTQALTQTPEFAARFPAIKQRQDAGLPAIGPGEYVQLERGYAQQLAQAGLPKGFYDRPEDFTSLIAKDVSVSELHDRITQGYQRVNQAPQEVKDYFAQKFGASGDAALASVFLDPNRALSELERQAQEAEIGGTGMQFGFNVAEPLANTLAAKGITAAQAQQGFEKLNTEGDLFKATVGETNETPLTQETGIKAEFGVSGDAQDQMRRRIEERQAEFTKGKAGGAEETQRGILGLATASK